MHPTFTHWLANEKVADLRRAADKDRLAAAARPSETETPQKRRSFLPRLRRPAVA